MTKFTPGPWEIMEIRVAGLSEPVITTSNRAIKICTMPALSNARGEVNARAAEIAANAALIAAAPELLEALQSAHSILASISSPDTRWEATSMERIRSVIAKATS